MEDSVPSKRAPENQQVVPDEERPGVVRNALGNIIKPQKRSKAGGLQVLSVDGKLLCCRFMRLGECKVPICKDLHLEKDKRPICPNFEKTGNCKFGRACWYNHPEKQFDFQPNVGIAILGYHLDRLKDYLREILPDIQFGAKGEISGSKHEGKALLCKLEGGISRLSDALKTSYFLDVCVDRLYAISDSDNDIYALMKRLISETMLPLEGKKFRVSCYPKSLEKTLSKCGGPGSLCDCCPSNCDTVAPELRLDLDPKAFTHLVSVVKAMGRFHGSIVPKGVCDTLSWGGKRRWDGGAAVCRAYYKMDEALSIWKCSEGVRALDVGAAPGGWSQCMLEHGASHVTAIDPGDLSPALSGLEGLEHLKNKFQVCIPDLTSRGEKYQLLVCDMNCSPVEVVDMIKDFMPILAPDAKIIITFKKFSATGKCTTASYEADKAKAMEMLGGMCEVGVVQRHLFNNTPDERTVYATLKPSA